MVKEDIVIKNKAFAIVRSDKVKEMINLVLPNESLNLFLVGDSEGKLFQFELDSFKLMKQYGDLRIGEILSGVCFRHFAFIGGSIGVCSIINLGLKSLLVKKIETSIEKIFSLNICSIKQKQSKSKKKKKFYLSVVGILEINNLEKGDFFELSFLNY